MKDWARARLFEVAFNEVGRRLEFLIQLLQDFNFPFIRIQILNFLILELNKL